MNQSSKINLVLVRHAHRDTSDAKLDNGLSDKGIIQAQELAWELKGWMGQLARMPKKILLLSSAKKRCVQTLEPLSKQLGVSIHVDPLLVEQKEDESNSEFVHRINQFLENCKKSDDDVLTIACSHGDWLPLAAEKLVGHEIAFKKGQWKAF